jgi:DNA-binding XRE family transcriptional regulator
MDQEKKITGRQIAAARDLLGMSQRTLASIVRVSVASLSAIENGHAQPRRQTATLISEALEARGIVFTNGDRPSVTLDRSKAVIPV